MITRIVAVDPGVSGAAVEIEVQTSAQNAPRFRIWSVHAGKPDADDVAYWMKIGPFSLFVMERQNIRVGKDSAFMVSTIAELHRTMGRWDVIAERPGFTDKVLELGWNDIKALVEPFLAVLRAPTRGRVAKAVEHPFPLKKKVSQLKLKAVEAVVKLLPPEQIETHFINRDGFFRDGPCDAFLLGVGAWLKEGKL